jgi:pyruvate formate-lyase activating enzyme-like uncharacterized protein
VKLDGLSELFERYAAGLARKGGLPAAEPDDRRPFLVRELVRRGIKGWPERGTFFTKTLPSGCKPCLKGQGSNVALTTLCTRECFFCFNPKPRGPGLSVHGRAVADDQEAVALLERLGICSVGLSGGEPLLEPVRALELIALLRRRFGGALRIDLYTNGDLLTSDLGKRLRDAGLDGLRVNLAANGYDVAPLRRALGCVPDVEVEIPVIPEHAGRLPRLIDELDALGVSHLILHELFVCAQNVDAMKRKGRRRTAAEFKKLSWSGVASSGEAALELLLYALEFAGRLSVYYCSCSTQEWIAENALRASAPFRTAPAQPRAARP